MSQPPQDAEVPPQGAQAPGASESAPPSGAEKARSERAVRLAAALRENLRRRKVPKPTAAGKDRN